MLESAIVSLDQVSIFIRPLQGFFEDSTDALHELLMGGSRSLETHFAGGHVRRFVIRPNDSMSAMASLSFFSSLACLSFVIAGTFFFLGMWLILPFAGLEMAALAFVLYLCHRRGKRREVVTVNDDTVVVSCGSVQPERVCLFKRAWAQVRLEPAPFRGHPRRLLIGSHGRHIEVGSCLSEPEKLALAGRLRETIQRGQP